MRLLRIVVSYLVALAFFSSSLSAQRLAVHGSMDAGGPALGISYELPDTATESYGIFTSFHSKDESDKAAGLLALGAFFKAKAQQGPYEFFFSPGFAMMHYDLFDDALIAGPSLQVGMTASLDARLGVGVSNQKLYSWIGRIQGVVSDAFFVHLTYRLD